MNYPPPTSPAPASQTYSPPAEQPVPVPAERHRRADRRPSKENKSAEKKPAGKKPADNRKKKKRTSWSTVQWIVFSLVLAAVIFAAAYWGASMQQLRDLRARREEEKIQYESMVAAHQVLYRDLIERYAAQYELNPAFVAAIIKQESNYNPRAVSSKNARGLMQLMPDTFAWVRDNTGYRDADISVLFEPEAAIKMGCYLLRYIINDLKTDDPVLVTCAYHAGWGNVRSWLSKYSTDGKTLAITDIPTKDTRSYAGKVMNSYAIYLQHYY